MTSPFRITEEQLQRSGPEAQKLLELALQQLDEHKKWLLERFVTAMAKGEIEQTVAFTLMTYVDFVKLCIVKPELSLKEGEKATVSVVYEYPDELYDLLSSPTCPISLGEALTGGASFTKLEVAEPVVVKTP